MKNSFTVRLMVRLTLTAAGIPPGFLHGLLATVFQWFMGIALDKKIIPGIDVTANAWEEAGKIEEFKSVAFDEYKRAKKASKSPEERAKILKEFLDTLEPVAKFGNGLRNN